MTTDEAKTLLSQDYGEGAARTIIEAILAAERKRLVEVFTEERDIPVYGDAGRAYNEALDWAIQQIEAGR